MESYLQETTATTCGSTNVEFIGVRPVYPLTTGTELITCYFTVPTQCRPEVGDWIGIYPVGWSSLVSNCIIQKPIVPDMLCPSLMTGEQCGSVQFCAQEIMGQTIKPDQYYQFVYCKMGESIRGASLPFTFLTTPRNMEQQIPSSIFGIMLSELEEQQKPKTEQVVEREMQKLENGIFGVEKGLAGYERVFPSIEESLKRSAAESMEQRQSRVSQVQEMLLEQVRLDQAKRRMEQLKMQVQLKQYERYIEQVVRREEEINEYLRAKMQQELIEFEQKVYNIVKLEEVEENNLQPEYYVRKYERLLKEKCELQIQNRCATLLQMRQTVRDCECRMREIEQTEQEHLCQFTQMLNTRFGQFDVQSLNAECELRVLVSEMICEKRREQLELLRSQHRMKMNCVEIEQRLCQIECAEIYSQLRIPSIMPMRVSGQLEIQQLEAELCALKQMLRQRIGQNELTPMECFIKTGEYALWKRLVKFERRLVELKAMIVEKQQCQQLKEKITDLEMNTCRFSQEELRQCLQEFQKKWQQNQEWCLEPEQFVLRQQEMENLWQMCAKQECSIPEQATCTLNDREEYVFCEEPTTSVETCPTTDETCSQEEKQVLEDMVERKFEEFESIKQIEIEKRERETTRMVPSGSWNMDKLIGALKSELKEIRMQNECQCGEGKQCNMSRPFGCVRLI